MSRLSYILRGPAALVVVLAVVVAGTVLTRHSHSSAHPSAVLTRPASASRPIPSKPKPALRPTVAGTGHSDFHLSAARRTAVLDPATGIHFRILKEVIGLGGRTRVRLLVQVQFNSGTRPGSYSRDDFFVLDRHGRAYAAERPADGRPGLQAGQIASRSAVTGWMAFDLSFKSADGILVWNDRLHLTPPATVLTYSFRRA